MRRPVRLRLTGCACALAATAAAGVLLAPTASAAPARDTLLPLDHLSGSNSDAPNRMTNVPPFGRKWG